MKQRKDPLLINTKAMGKWRQLMHSVPFCFTLCKNAHCDQTLNRMNCKNKERGLKKKEK